MSIHHMVRTILVRSEYPCDPEQTAPVDEWLRTLNRTSSRPVCSWLAGVTCETSQVLLAGGQVVESLR